MKKGMQNKRYRQTEDAILEVLLGAKEMPSVGELTKRAKISRSTLYRHHRAMPGIIPDYEKEVLKNYKRTVKKSLKQKNVELKNVYLQMLIFILKRKRVFEILFRYEGGRVVERMVIEIKEQIVRVCHLPKNYDKMLRIYTKEVSGVVEEWAKDSFSEEKMGKTLSDIIYLTETMRARLGPVR